MKRSKVNVISIMLLSRRCIELVPHILCQLVCYIRSNLRHEFCSSKDYLISHSALPFHIIHGQGTTEADSSFPYYPGARKPCSLVIGAADQQLGVRTAECAMQYFRHRLKDGEGI